MSKEHDKEKQKEANDLADLLETVSHDSQSTTNEGYAEGLLKAHSQIIMRNALLTNLLAGYINSSNKRACENTILKRILFAIFVFILIFLTVALFFVFIKVDFNEVTTPLVVSLLAVGATYVGSLFTIYEIMFKYLFPADEEKDTISMIKTVIENDLKVEEFVSKVGTAQPQNGNDNSE